VRTLELLRKKDLHPEIDMPKSTVADWIEDFNVYIPKVKRGNVTYYRPETIDVLKFVKQCRDQNYQKPQIMEMLAKKGFPITVDEAVEDIKKALEFDSPRDTLLTVMQTQGQALVKIAEQDERLDKQDESLKALEDKGNEQDGRLNELEKRNAEIDYLKQELEEMKKQLAATLEKNEKKSFWGRLLGK
jgi:DNA-binding transcriptional MerR regulator